MFDNIGNKVKGLAIFACAVGIIGSLIGAIVLWVNGLIGAGFGTLFGGCLSAWIGSWVIYCIGDTNVRTTELERQINSLEKAVGNINRTPEQEKRNEPKKRAFVKMTLTPEQVSGHEDRTMEPVDSPDREGDMSPIPVDEDREKCPACGTVQKSGRNVCWNCGTHFQRDEQA